MSNHTPARTVPLMDGTQRLYRFPNGYGASLVDHTFAYGGLELAVVRFESESLDDYGLTYSTPITDDVIGYLKPDDVDPLLDSIAALPNPAQVLS